MPRARRAVSGQSRGFPATRLELPSRTARATRVARNGNRLVRFGGVGPCSGSAFRGRGPARQVWGSWPLQGFPQELREPLREPETLGFPCPQISQKSLREHQRQLLDPPRIPHRLTLGCHPPPLILLPVCNRLGLGHGAKDNRAVNAVNGFSYRMVFCSYINKVMHPPPPPPSLRSGGGGGGCRPLTSPLVWLNHLTNFRPFIGRGRLARP